MSSAQVGAVLRHIRKLATPREDPEPPDGRLLERFAHHRDEAAFAALLRRHGPMVLGVCRGVLHDAHDAEDAFQAAFLLLAQKAGSIHRREAVSGWLYRVAYHVAVRARAGAARRRALEQRAVAMPSADPVLDMSLRELRGVLHEELQGLPEQYRAPLVLCGLEEKSLDEAARLLGWTPGAVKGRLQRGREQLRARLRRRGLELPAGLFAAVLSAGAASAEVPAALAGATLRAALKVAAGGGAVAGVASAEVAALVRGAGKSLGFGKLKVGAVLLLVAAFGAAGLGAFTLHAPAAGQADPGRKEAAAPAPPANPDALTVRGRVLDPAGKPLTGAKLYLSSYTSRGSRPKIRAVSGAGGEFRFPFAKAEITEPAWRPDAWRVAAVVAVAPGFAPDWAPLGRAEKGRLTLRLVKEGPTIAGRVVDTEGRPLAGVTVRRRQILTTAKEDLTPVLTEWKRSRQPHGALHLADKTLSGLAAVGLGGAVKTGPDGRFRLPGGGRERLTQLRIEGPAIQWMTVYVVPRDPAEIKALTQAPAEPVARVIGSGPLVYGPTFDHVANPTKPVVGTVRERGTGKPLAGVKVWGSAAGGWWENTAEATTDARGRYRLVGLPKADRRQLFAVVREGEPYHHAAKVAPDTPGLDPVTVDFELVRGVVVEGRVTDKETGKPVQGIISYVPLPDDGRPRDTAEADAYRFAAHGCNVDREGKYRIVVLPGAGVLLAQSGAQEDNRYRRAHFDPADRKKPFAVQDEIQGEYFDGLNGARAAVGGANAYRLIHPPRRATTFTCNFELDPGLAKAGSVVGPDGQPLAGVTALGLNAVAFGPRTLATASFTAWGLDPERPRSVVFYHPRRKLAAHVALRGDEKGPLQVRLRPLGTITGHLVGPAGKPIAAARVYLSFLDLDGTRVWLPSDPGQTDAGGKFRIGGVYPGLRFYLTVTKGNSLLLDGRKGARLAVRGGETKDLGNLKAARSGED